MTTIEISTGLGKNGGNPTAYGIAGRRIVTDAYLPELPPYRMDGTATWSAPAASQVMAAAPSDPLTYSGKGWIANAWRDVECRRARNGFELRFPGLATFWIAEDGCFIQLTAVEQTAAEPLLWEAALGAPVVIALALQGVFCLHVSVVQTGGRVVAFAGESGQGKSTLARFLGFESGPAWRRIIDDSLPVTFSEAVGVEALTHFPQLKLPTAYQPVNIVPPKMPLDALYVLADSEGSQKNGVQIEPLTNTEAMLAVLRHMVAARLFDRRLLARHLAFAADAAADMPIRSLAYPRRFECLPAVRDQLHSDLADLFEDD